MLSKQRQPTPQMESLHQQRTNGTMDALTKLRQAEQKVLQSLQHAASSFRALSTSVNAIGAAPAGASTNMPPVSSAMSSTNFEKHADALVAQLLEAQALIRDRIQNVGADLPFENVTLRRLIESDLAIQRTAHIHRALVFTLAKLGEHPIGDPNLPPTASAPSPPYMPSPASSTPLTAFGPVANSPSTAPQQPITLSVRSPDVIPPPQQQSSHQQHSHLQTMSSQQSARNGPQGVDPMQHEHQMADVGGGPDPNDHMEL